MRYAYHAILDQWDDFSWRYGEDAIYIGVSIIIMLIIA